MATIEKWDVVEDLKCPICGEHPTVGPCSMIGNKVVEYQIECDQEFHHVGICGSTKERVVAEWMVKFGKHPQ